MRLIFHAEYSEVSSDTSLPYLLALGGICLALSVAVSLLTSLYSAWKISRTRLDNLIKGEEL